MVFGIGGDDERELQIRVRAETAGANASLERLEGTIDDVGDEAVVTSAQLTGMGAAANSAGASMGFLSGRTFGVSNSLLALGAAATPVVAVLGSLATGAAAVVGSGLVAYSQELTEQYEEADSATEALMMRFGELRREIVRTAVVPLGEQFIPLIRDAIDAIPVFARRIVNAMGDLRPFRRLLEGLGNWAMNDLPGLIRGFLDLGRGVQQFSETAAPGIARVAERTGDLETQLGRLDQTLTDAELGRKFGAFLIALGTGLDLSDQAMRSFRDTVTSVFSSVIDAIQTTITLLGQMARGWEALEQGDVQQARSIADDARGTISGFQSRQQERQEGLLQRTRERGRGFRQRLQADQAALDRLQNQPPASARVGEGAQARAPQQQNNIGTINIYASDRRGGRAAADAFERELRSKNISDSSSPGG